MLNYLQRRGIVCRAPSPFVGWGILTAAGRRTSAADPGVHGRAGGLVGGAARAARLSHARKVEIGRMGAAARWGA